MSLLQKFKQFLTDDLKAPGAVVTAASVERGAESFRLAALAAASGARVTRRAASVLSFSAVTISVCAMRGTPAKAASVCHTSGAPPIGSYRNSYRI